MKRLRQLVWLYLILLLFEGALRKWIVPALDAPLLIVRDPVVLLIYYYAFLNRLQFLNAFFVPNLVLAVLTGFFSIAFGQGNLVITVYGLRADFLQIPLIFLIPQILNRDDVLRMGRFILYLAPLITLLVLMQFKSPQDSFINKGAMGTHYGTVRPSGPFSFITGIISFYSLASAFLFYGYLHQRTFRLWLLALATPATLIAASVSGSRSTLIGIALVAAVAIFCVLVRGGKGGLNMLIGMAMLAVAVGLLSTLPVFKEGAAQLEQRFEDAGVVEGNTAGLFGRFFSTFTDPLSETEGLPTFGFGLGMATNAAAGLLTGDRVFLGPENEWGRLIYESGPVLGVTLCLFRVALTLTVGFAALRAILVGNVLPILIFSAGGLLLLNGQWGVPTTLGFAIFEAGLVLAACRYPDDDDGDDDEEDTGDEEGEDPGEQDGTDEHDDADEVNGSLSP